jgi:hypothetical protein
MDANDLNDAPDETVEKGQGHDQQVSPSTFWLIKSGRGVLGPFTLRRRFLLAIGPASCLNGPQK